MPWNARQFIYRLFLASKTLHTKSIYTITRKNFSLHESTFYRSNEFSILTKTSVCIDCSQKQMKLLQMNNESINGKANSLTMPLKSKAPIPFTSPERIKGTIQSYQIENKILKSEIVDLIKIISNTGKSEVSPFMNFFLEEQQKYLNVSCKTSIRYHSMII